MLSWILDGIFHNLLDVMKLRSLGIIKRIHNEFTLKLLQQIQKIDFIQHNFFISNFCTGTSNVSLNLQFPNDPSLYLNSPKYS